MPPEANPTTILTALSLGMPRSGRSDHDTRDPYILLQMISASWAMLALDDMIVWLN
jgi:hypothetical protein